MEGSASTNEGLEIGKLKRNVNLNLSLFLCGVGHIRIIRIHNIT